MSLRERVQSFNSDIVDIVIPSYTPGVIIYNFGTTEYNKDDIGNFFSLKPKVAEAIKSVFKYIHNKTELTAEMIGLLTYLGYNTTHDAVESFDIESLNLLMDRFLNVVERKLQIKLERLVNGGAIGQLYDYLPMTEEAAFDINQNAIERS